MPLNPADYTHEKLTAKSAPTHYKKLSAEFQADPSDAEARFNAIYLALTSKPDEILPKKLQAHLGNHIKELVASIENIQNKRDMMQKVAYLYHHLTYRELQVQGVPEPFDAALWTAALTQVKLSGGTDTPIAPTRIIAFHHKDYDNLEVIASVKIAFEKHIRKESCLVSCSEREIIAYGNSCTTLIFIGHGRFCRAGDLDAQRRELTPRDAQRSREREVIFLGPYKGFIATIATSTTDLLRHTNLSHLKHCRLVMCMSGAIPREFRSEDHIIYYKKKSGENLGCSSATVVVHDTTEIVFEPESIAGMIWHNLFVAESPYQFELKRDFALTASAEIINPIPDKQRFEGTANPDRWNSRGYTQAPSFWKTGAQQQAAICETKSITLATSESTKMKKRTEAGVDETDQYQAPTYFRTVST